MLRLVKILFGTIAVIFIGLACIFIGFFLLDKYQWNEASDNPFVESIGKWGGESFEAEVIIDSKLLPLGTSRQNWVALMEKNDFAVFKESENCSLGINTLESLEEYDSCAAKILHDPGCCSCSYAYVVAAKFENDSLKKAIGTHNYFMCL